MHITHIKTDLHKEVFKISFSKLPECFLLRGDEKSPLQTNNLSGKKKKKRTKNEIYSQHQAIFWFLMITLNFMGSISTSVIKIFFKNLLWRTNNIPENQIH